MFLYAHMDNVRFPLVARVAFAARGLISYRELCCLTCCACIVCPSRRRLDAWDIYGRIARRVGWIGGHVVVVACLPARRCSAAAAVVGEK